MEVQYLNYLSMKKLIITVAPVEGMHDKEGNPNHPITPDEIATATYDCYNAGASVIHIHVRDKEGQATADLNVYKEVLTKIKQKCNIITQVGNGIGIRNFGSKIPYQFGPEERLNLLNIEPKPDMFAINGGTFGPWGIVIFENSPEFNKRFLKGGAGKGVKDIECEIYDLSHIHSILDLKEGGYLQEPLHFSFVQGMGGGMPATPENLLYFVRSIPEGSTWQVSAISRFQIPVITMAMSIGGNIRVGFEDNPYYSRGVLAKSNAETVEKVVRLAKELGREIATVEEAREILNLKG